jgi:hypothetical protein
MILGLIGKINSGKNTFANSLIKDFNFISIAFADPLKKIAQEMFDIPTENLWGPSEKRDARTRTILQVLGTDIGRGIDPDIWVKKTLKRIKILQKENHDIYGLIPNINKTSNIVITDVRFPNEAQALKDMRGILIHLIRPQNYEITNIPKSHQNHYSEQAIDEIPKDIINYTIMNDSDLMDFIKKSKKIIKALLQKNV